MTSAKQAFNFCSGPAMLPRSVMEQAQAELLDYQSSGISIMEVSHRSNIFQHILQSATARLRDLMSIPDNYEIIFMQGGASLQFSCVPMNLMRGGSALYLNSGYWAEKAITEAQKYGAVVTNKVLVEGNAKYSLAWDNLNLKANLYDYIHYTPNETINGIEYKDPLDTGDIPLVADMSSCILSQPVDVSRFGLIYAGAQKNIGPAGLTVVIVRKDLLSIANEKTTPRLLHYQTVVENKSMANTPPTFAIYLADLVFKWLQQQGGLTRIADVNAKKSSKLYSAIDHSRLYHNSVELSARSRMNVPFTLRNGMENVFVEAASQEGLLNLAGHRSVGGCRASLYNAMPVAGVTALIDFMNYFENNYV